MLILNLLIGYILSV